MGIAAGLFHSSNSEKASLHRSIMPSDEQRESQQERWNALAEYLCDWLKDRTGYGVRTWLQGSYKFGTQIRPSKKGDEFDIDLGVYLEHEGSPEEMMNASQLKEYVQDALVEYSKEVKDVREVVSPPKERCARIRYDASFHIDVPGYHLDPGKDERTLATESFGYEDSDPKALVKWFLKEAGSNDDRTQLRRMIRYLKMWAALKIDSSKRPSSILLTVLAVKAYGSISSSVCEDDDVFGALITSVRKHLQDDREVPNPVNTKEDLNRLGEFGTRHFLERLEELEEICDRAIDAKTELEASIIWSEAFDHFFPMADEEPRTNAGGADCQFPVALRPLEIKVVADCTGSGRPYNGTNSIGPIPNNCRINFKLGTELPPTATVEWMVRNHGAEAEKANDMGYRSGGEFSKSVEETSKYNGSHHMDCIVKDGRRVIGVQRVPVRIIDAISRNPPKPGYPRSQRRHR